jgi:hypothetical protein
MGRRSAASFQKLFPADVMSKRERVEATLNHQPLDRAAILEQLSYNSRVIAMYTGKPIQGFDYTLDDICCVIRKTTDLIMPPTAPLGTARVTDRYGFVRQQDNWTGWHVGRPFSDSEGACRWLRTKTADLRNDPFDPATAREEYRQTMTELQRKIGETVILNYTFTGFCYAFDSMGLEIYTFFSLDHPDVLAEYMEASVASELARIHAVADPALSPVILIAEDFSTKQGPIFPPDFLTRYHYPCVKQVTAAWHEHGVKVLYHSDGNYRKAVPDLMAAGVDGFYCLEPSCGMDVVELKKTWPQMVWSGGVDGVDLMERGTPEKVRAEVRRQILESQVLETGGMFVATSSEINPPIPPENFQAMVETVGATRNAAFG